MAHIDFGLRKKPEETLPDNGDGVGDNAGRLIGNGKFSKGKSVCSRGDPRAGRRRLPAEC